jgi:hypothetical protein
MATDRATSHPHCIFDRRNIELEHGDARVRVRIPRALVVGLIRLLNSRRGFVVAGQRQSE